MAKPGFTWDADDPMARCEGETLNAWAALNDYARMGPGRSLDKLHAAYQIQIESGLSAPPVRNRATLGQWSVDHDWQARVAAFDAAESERQTEKYRDWNDAELERMHKAVEVTHGLYDELLAAVDKRKVPPRDMSALLRALSEVSRQARGDADRLELSGPGGGAIQTEDVTDHEARAARILALMREQAEDASDED